MLELRDISFTHDGADQPTLAHVDLVLDEGELLLVAGPTGSGKSTLLGIVAGLVPRFSGGVLRGDVLLDGRSIVTTPPRERAASIGYVGQDPAAGFVTDTVEEELAYGMEQLGLPPDTMRRRVEETLDLLGIADLRDRDLRTLSGGQQQRVAIGSVLTMHPRLLVLDEPTSALDPTAAEDVLATVTRLVHDLGVSVLLAEHRLERVVPFADRMALLDRSASEATARVTVGDPPAVLAASPVAPPLVELGRALGWSPLPLTVRDARRQARDSDVLANLQGNSRRLGEEAPTRGRSADSAPQAPGMPRTPGMPETPGMPSRQKFLESALLPRVGTTSSTSSGSSGSSRDSASGLEAPGLEAPGLEAPGLEALGLEARGVTVVRGGVVALRELGLSLRGRGVTALMGRNGAGKSTLLWALQGTLGRKTGTVSVFDRPRDGRPGTDPARLSADERRGVVGLLPQNAADLLYLETVDEECATGGPRTREILDSLVPGIPGDRHPRDLSEGQRLALALALVLAAEPSVLLLDEPTRGLDYAAKQHLVGALRALADDDRTVLVATHDVEFAALVADDVVVLAEGEVVSSGGSREVLAESPAFAPQVTKVLGPGWLTVEDVLEAKDSA